LHQSAAQLGSVPKGGKDSATRGLSHLLFPYPDTAFSPDSHFRHRLCNPAVVVPLEAAALATAAFVGVSRLPLHEKVN
jgi:hypothetical protein